MIQPAHSHHTLLYVAPRAPPSSARSRCPGQSAVPLSRQSALHPLNPLPWAIRCPTIRSSSAQSAAPGNPLSRSIRSSSAQSAALGNPLSHHPLFIRSIRCPGQSAVPLNPLFIRSIRCPGQSAVPHQSALHPLNPLPRAIRCPAQSALHPLNPLPWAIRCPAPQSAALGNPLSRSIRCPGQSAVPLSLVDTFPGSEQLFYGQIDHTSCAGHKRSAWVSRSDLADAHHRHPRQCCLEQLCILRPYLQQQPPIALSKQHRQRISSHALVRHQSL